MFIKVGQPVTIYKALAAPHSAHSLPAPHPPAAQQRLLSGLKEPGRAPSLAHEGASRLPALS